MILHDGLCIRGVILHVIRPTLLVALAVLNGVVKGEVISGRTELTDETVAVTHPCLGLRTHTLAVCLGAFTGGPDIPVIGAVQLFGHGDPLVRAAEIDLVFEVSTLVVIDFHLIGSFQIPGIRPEPSVIRKAKKTAGIHSPL